MAGEEVRRQGEGHHAKPVPEGQGRGADAGGRAGRQGRVPGTTYRVWGQEKRIATHGPWGGEKEVEQKGGI